MLTPSRLTLARKRRGLTLVDLATATEVSVRSLSAYENGRQRPSQDTLRRLAAVLDVPVAFLQASDVDEIPIDAISFRAISKLTAGQRDTARSAGRIALMLAEWIEQRFHLPLPEVPSLPTLDPETAAEVVRARWGLGVAPLGNLVRLLEAHGVRVFSLAADCAAVDAFSFVWRQTPYVLLNTAKSGERGRFDAAHELGHLVQVTLHRVGKYPTRGTNLMRVNLDPGRPEPGQALGGTTLTQNVANKSCPTVMKIPAFNSAGLQKGHGVVDRLRPACIQSISLDICRSAVRGVNQVRCTAAVGPIDEAGEPHAAVAIPHPLVLFQLHGS
jgi:transcriptional regulator with XRE-family HTH domain